LIEILVGVVAGNFLHLQANTDWINFLALLGSGVLTFLAGAEIDPESLKANLRASLLIGIISFAIPFLLVWLFAQFVLGWPLPQAQIAGIALSTTSVAVVYAVMIEGGLSDTSLGKMILAACFITDFGTVLMATGLTFGTISALFGLPNKIIDQRQYTILVTVMILSAFITTLIAQKFFQPTLKTMQAWGRLYRRKETFRSALEAVRN
jgi:Kef-type K+ transport system membrane component KefB